VTGTGRGYLALGVALTALATVAVVVLVARDGALPFGPGRAALAADTVDGYCIDCHNAADFTGNLALDDPGLADIGARAETWEKVVHKINAGSMPPLGEPRPDARTYARVVDYLEAELDAAAAARPNPGSLPLLHRLTRTEYANAVRDLLALDDLPAEMGYELLLPADNASSGFDNIAELLFVSPVVMERYLGAAQKIARLAVGDMSMPTMVNRHRLPLELPQDQPVAGSAFGTRGGLVTESYFPLDAEYVFGVELAGFAREPHEIEITVDGARVALGQTGGRGGPALEFRVPVSAGPHVVGATFVRRTHALDESTVRVQRRSRGTLPAIELVTVSGPYAPTGPGVTPSRERIFVCRPAAAAEERDCAREILVTLARRAYRRAAGEADVETLLAFYEDGRAGGGFDAGIQRALERLLVSPQFLYRIERVPEAMAPGEAFAVTPLELASRLSFFLWSSLPDERLLALAETGELAAEAVLASEVERMLADPRAASLVDNFASQWLFLRDVEGKDPDLFIFRDYDESLREAFITETELFVASILHEDRSVLDLIRASHTFVNERLAEHYGIPYIEGSRFRRVTLPADSPRGGLLGQGSVLTLTSYPTRTSPVLRGKYVLDNLLASPPPPPPPDVPTLETEDDVERATMTLRESMARHRENPECASCHAQMDPIGFAFEHFDAVGRWRETDGGLPIEAASTLPDGRVVDGVEGVKQLLLGDPERFVGAVTEKLLMYALGRNIQYYDRPAIRAIVRDAAADDYTFPALVRGIVLSVPFRMRMAPEAGPTDSEG
jgi:mono/diheme cytochrome c family protein